jgi:hypothetical protein
MATAGSGLIASAGPFIGVRTIDDAPYVDSSKFLYSAHNGYIRDAADQSSWVSRPGFVETNASAPIGGGKGVQGAHSHVDPATGTIYRFFVANGVVYRSNAAFTTFTDVSPVGIAVDTSAKVAMISVGGSMVVTDGVNRPWIASNFGGTPITGTYIDIDGAGGSWSTFGAPTIYQDSVMFITATVPGGSAVDARVGFVWSEPNQPAVGYTQSGYADFWNVIETGTEPLYCILGTNSGLFIWRENSITVAAGTPSINFSSTATRDSRGDAVGSVSPWAVSIFGNNIFFYDNRGRQWMMPLDGQPVPLWQQLNSNASVAQADLTRWGIGSVVPELNLCTGAIPLDGNFPPNFFNTFDGASGGYMSEWRLANGNFVHSIDVMLDAVGAHVLCMTSFGTVWILQSVVSGVWADTGTTDLGVITGNLGFSADSVLYPNSATIILKSPGAVSVILFTPWGEFSIGTVTPIVVAGKTPNIAQYRAVVGLDGVAVRWVQFDIQPTVTTAQFGVQRIDVFGSVGPAGVDDP